jgi:glycosyltransferase domain-containing protein
MADSTELTILTPTLNRPEFIERALSYYAALRFRGVFYLGDSSNDSNAGAIRRLVEAFSSRLRIRYRYFPNPPYLNDGHCMKAMIDDAPTEYLVYAGDDDLLVPGTFDRCVEFLAKNPGYSAAHGQFANFVVDSTGAYGPITRTYLSVGHTTEATSAVVRWRHYMRHALSTQYYVHKRQTWRRMYENVDRIPLRYIGPELLPCSMSLICGRIKEIDGLATLFQVNESKEFGWKTHSMYRMSIDANWTPAVRTFRDIIVRALSDADGIPPAEAGKHFDKEFWRHLIVMMQAHWDMRFEPNSSYSLIKRRAPVAIRLVNFLRGNRYRKPSGALRDLLSNRHPYHRDFAPAYRVVTGQKNPHD